MIHYHGTPITPKRVLLTLGAMDEDEFEELYNATIAVIVKHVLQNYDEAMLKSIMEQVEEFDG